MVVFSLLILSNTFFPSYYTSDGVQTVRVEVMIIVYEIDYCISEIKNVLYIVFWK